MKVHAARAAKIVVESTGNYAVIQSFYVWDVSAQ